jgi:hypothetical protein
MWPTRVNHQLQRPIKRLLRAGGVERPRPSKPIDREVLVVRYYYEYLRTDAAQTVGITQEAGGEEVYSRLVADLHPASLLARSER